MVYRTLTSDPWPRQMIRPRVSVARTSMQRLPLPLTAALPIALLTLFVGSAGAARAVPCWKLIQNDAYDRHIDGTYSVRCYREAIERVPGDSLIYGELRQELTQAMLDAIRSLRRKGLAVRANTQLPGTNDRARAGGQNHGFFAEIARKIGPGNATSLPLPLLVLGGLGLLLVVSACTSFTARRLGSRGGKTPGGGE
jgi:hypothetical protein